MPIHIVLHPDDKPRNPADYDRIICAELPEEAAQPELYGTLTSCMLHGPCGTYKPNSPCMTQDGVCSKHYRKEFLEDTRETDGYPEYRRRYE